MLLIYVDELSRPQVFADIEQAKRFVEHSRAVTANEGARWYESSDRWLLSMRWRSELAVLWKAQVQGR